MTAVKDVVSGASLTKTEDGLEAVRVFTVGDLSGDPSVILYKAMQDGSIPKRGDAHPSIPGLNADQVAVAPEGPTAARVTVTYREGVEDSATGVYSIEIGSRIVKETTSTDANGQPIETTYNLFDPATSEYKPKVYQHEIEVERVQLTYTVRAKLDYNPVGLAHDLAGTVGTWDGGDLPNWLCTGVSAVSEDNGKSWDTVFEFAQDTQENGWQTEVKPPTLFGIQIDPDAHAHAVMVYNEGPWDRLHVPPVLHV